VPANSLNASAAAPIGFIAGSENNPEKRWPVEHWRALLNELPSDLPVVLFGTANDQPITRAIAEGRSARVTDLAGRTTLPEYCARLAACRLLVTNDTGGMHLANALGVPLIALFGPTNPRRTRPIFASSVEILQPPGCPATGGAPLTALSPATVAAAVRTSLARAIV
jgi:ADP-heptose:LPS heptosyltransferase